MGETKSEPPKIKVIDRRKFSSEGDPLDTAAPTDDAAPTASPAGDRVAEREDPIPVTSPPAPPAEELGQSSRDFLELVSMLAGHAELLLVGSEDLPAQPEESQRLINYLGVLEEKTAGNLSADEAKILSNVLYELRTIFLQRK